MTSSTVATLITGAVNSISDSLVASLPTVFSVAGAVLALIVVWKLARRFVGGR